MAEKILVVDDHTETRNLVSTILKRQGYDVSTASTGIEGLSAAEAETPDLILLDVMMPEMNGYETCRRLREHPHLSQVPVVMFTAKSQAGEKWEGFQAGATDYIVKPTNTEELSQRVRSILDRSPRPLVPEDATTPQNATISVPSPVAKSAAKEVPSQVIGVVGVRGGTGTTTAAINIAFALAQNNLQTLLVDLDMSQGHVGLYLNRPVKMGLNALSTIGAADIPKAMAQYTLSVGKNLNVLLAKPNLSNQIPVLDENQVPYLADTFSPSSKQVVFDLGVGLTEINRPILKRAHQIVVCLRPERIAVSATKQMLAQLKQIAMAESRLYAIMFDFGQGVQLPRKAVENFIGHALYAIIAIQHQEMAQAVNSGKPLLLARPKAAASEAFKEFAKQLVPK